MFKHLLALLLITALLPIYAQAQDDSDDIYDMSLEELMNMTIVSASRSEEKAFEAPLSSYAITSKEIFNSGATSIPDALRLCPGLFVKEMANGVYDVSVRGMDNILSHQYLNTNRLILVMINNRPVFDYLYGATFWQNLPVDIVDVEKLEVVLGPSAPLYGPNAVTGVINIITKNADKEDFSAVANVQVGTPDTYIGQAWVGYNINDKMAITGSVNYTNRGRSTVEYYDIGRREYITDLNETTHPAFQDTEAKKLFFSEDKLALEKIAGNIGFSYQPTTDVKLDIAGGFTDNTALYGFSIVDAASYFSNNSVFGAVKGEAKGFSFSGSVLSGKQGLLGEVGGYYYDYKNFDGYLDYNFKLFKNLNLRPAISYQSSTINDEPYTVEKGNVGIFNSKASMYNYAASLKADYTVGKLRLIGALRTDKFKYPNDLYFSYQGMINYKLNEKNNLRAVVAKSNSGSFITNTFVNSTARYPGTPFATETTILGNKDRNLVENQLFEVGYRAQILSNLQVDISLFRQQAAGFVGTVRQQPEVDVTEGVIRVDILTSDIDVKAVQQGLTMAINWVALKNTLNIKPFITLQKTEWLDYSPYFVTPEYAAATGNPDYSTETKNDVESKATPTVYGGFYANYTPSDKLNINVNGYLMSEYEMFTVSTSQFQAAPYDEYPASYIDGKFILNAKVGYQLTPNVNIFASVRNALNSDGREYFGMDKIGAMYLGGVLFNL